VTTEGELLWEPSAERIASARITEFAKAAGHGDVTYAQLWQWSVDDLDAFWAQFAAWAGVRWLERPSATLGTRAMPGAQWFPGGRLNYAEHLLYPPCGVRRGRLRP
jgi:acetoacetyl-CoA synthetase